VIIGGGIGAEIAPYFAKRWTLWPDVMDFLEEYEALDAGSPTSRNGATKSRSLRARSAQVAPSAARRAGWL